MSEWLRVVEATKIDVEASTLANRDSLIRTHVDPSIGQWPINRITAELLQEWVSDLSKARSPATVRKAFEVVGEGFKLAMARSKVIRNPAVGIRLPRLEAPEHRYLEEGEVWALADAMALYMRPFVLLGAFAGLRPGEGLALRWRELDLERSRLQVASTLRRDGSLKSPKTKTSRRTVTIPDVLAAELVAHRDQFPSAGFVLHSDGKPITTHSVRRRGWNRAVRDSVGEPMRLHDLRHTHAACSSPPGCIPR
ncbi:MAG: tyrosine-type recombinase/integrase [Acidimicrobiia bacterium]